MIYEHEFRHLDVSSVLKCLKLLRKDHNATVPLIKRLMSAGTPAAHKRVASTMSRAFSHIHEAHHYAANDDSWEYRCDWVWSPDLAPELLKHWNYGNVAEELGGDIDEAVVISAIDSVRHGMLGSDVEFTVLPTTDAYWRGVMALALAKVPFRATKEMRLRAQIKARRAYYEQVDEFVQWAGTHPDIALVIKTTKERRTINVSDLEAIMGQCTGVPALVVGAL